MARKKTKSKHTAHPNYNVKIWDDGDRLELLAYLNWCIQAEVDFETTAVDHLRETTGKDFSVQQIEGKLRREWTNFGKTDSFEHVYRIGTAAFLSAGEEEDKRIGDIVIRLGPPPVLRYDLRSSLSRFNTRSHTLSTVPSVRGTPVSAPTPKQASHLLGISHPNDSQKSPNQRKNIGTPVRFMTPDVSHSSSHGLAHEVCSGVFKEEGSELAPISSVNNSDRELSDSSSLSINKDNGSQVSTQAQFLDMKAKLESTQADLLKQEAYVFTLRNRLSETRSELEAMHNHNQGASVDLHKLQQEIHHLKGCLQEQDRLLNHLTPLRTEKVGVPAVNVQKHYDALSQEIHDSCSFVGDVDPNERLPRQLDHSHKSAEGWAKRVSNWTLEHLIAYTKSKGIPMDKACASLIGAAILELVFEPVFPEVLALESPLLHQYRRQIFTKEGPQALRELDHVALKCLTSEEYFKSELIPEKAKSLAVFTLQNLQFFLPLGSEIPAHLTRGCLNDLSADLVNPLIRAINLKVSFDLSMARLKFIYFKPGDAFNANIMKRDISQPVNPYNTCQDSQQGIKICLLPALYALPAGNYDKTMEDSIKQFSASCNDSFTEGRGNDLESSVLMAKAIVIV